MATVGRQRGGRGGGGGGGQPRGGGDAGNQRRGSWRGGPPGSMGYSAAARGGSPVGNGAGAQGGVGGGQGGTGPRVSINDHMMDMKKVQAEKPAGNKGLQTDTDISSTSRASPAQRELQPWSAPDNTSGPKPNGTSTPSNSARGKDTETFGAGEEKAGKWDQFETNARLFGTKTSYQEEIYTTKLNKGGSDFKQREKEAERLANEIMGQSSANMHVMEERNDIVEDWAKDEEEKYSGVQRGPGAYVPPAARKSQGGPAGPGGYAAAAGRALPTGPTTQTGKANGASTPSASPAPAAQAAKAAPAPAKSPAPAISETVAAAQPPAPASDDKVTAKAAEPETAKDAKPIPDSSIAEPTTSREGGSAGIAAPATVASPNPAAAVTNPDAKDGLDKVVGAYRQFVDSEREKVEAKKQSMAKSEREKQLAELKRFQASFKVPLPMPKDILPILSKDEDRQKIIEAKAQVSLQAAKAEAEAKKNPDLKSPPQVSAASLAKSPDASRSGGRVVSKKIPMHIAEIPPFKSARQPSVTASTGPLPVSDSAKGDIPQITSPAPSATASQTEQAKLNPKASAFVFKPTAAAFKPGQSSVTSSPAMRAPQVSAAAGPSVPRNPFFGDQVPGRVTVDLRTDFNPFRHGQVPLANTIPPNWPYTGRPVQISFYQSGPPMGFGMEEEMMSPQLRPGIMQNMQGGGYPPYYRYGGQPGMPPQQPGQGPAGMPQNPMFSPGPGHAHLPGMPQYMGGGGPHAGQIPHGQHQHPGNVPLYFQNGLPQNPQFLPQHMQQFGMNPNNIPLSPQQRHGHSGGPGPGPGQGQGQGQGQRQGQPGMFYTQGQLPTPHHTPQMQPNLPFPPPGSANPGQQAQLPPQQPPGQGQGQGGPPEQFEGSQMNHPQQQMQHGLPQHPHHAQMQSQQQQQRPGGPMVSPNGPNGQGVGASAGGENGGNGSNGTSGGTQ